MGNAYVIGHITVKDAAKWDAYRGAVPATLAPWGAELVFRGSNARVLAGEHAQAGRLAAAGRADENEELALGDVEIEVGDGWLGAPWVHQRDVVVLDLLGHVSNPFTGRNVPDDPSGSGDDTVSDVSLAGVGIAQTAM